MSLRFAAATAALALPSSAWASVCAERVPGWDGVPFTALDELLHLSGTLPVLVLLAGSALSIALGSQWGGLAVIVLWTVLTTYIIMGDSALTEAATQEGCLGSPALFVTLVAAICVAIVLKTRPRLSDSDSTAGGPDSGDT